MKDFKWATAGLWTTHFADKEILFHLFLVPFTYFSDLYFGLKLAGVFLSTLFFTSFYSILSLNKVRYPLFWFLVLLSSGLPYLSRLVAPRPHLLSMILLLWSVHFLLQGKHKSLFFICWIYTWAYSAPILPLVFSILLVFQSFFLKRKNPLNNLVHKVKIYKMPLAAFAGIMTGLIANPYFPRNLPNFFMVNFYVLWANHMKDEVSRHMGNELWPLDTREFLLVNPFLLFIFMGCMYLSLRSSRPPLGNPDAEEDRDERELKVGFLFLLTATTLTLTFLNHRFIEYSFPLMVLFCGFCLTPYLNFPAGGRKLPRAFLATLLILPLLGTFFHSYGKVAHIFSYKETPYKIAAQFIKKEVPKGEIIFTCSWDYPSQLLFFDDDHRYLVFLDPNYLYFSDRKKWAVWQEINQGNTKEQTGRFMEKEFGARYGVCPKKYLKLYELAKEGKGLRLLFEDSFLFIFQTLANPS